MKRIVILGGGFGGIYAALQLERDLRGDSDVEVTLVARENFFLFTPMLHEVATSGLDGDNIVSPIRFLLKRTQFIEGWLDKIDLEGRKVVVRRGLDQRSRELPYDHLIIALGSETNFFGIPGLAERAVPMKSLADAILLRNRLIALLEAAHFSEDKGERRSLLTVVVAGGGFSGVETIGAVNDFLRESVRFYPQLTKDMVRAVLVHPGEFILPELGEKLGRYAQRRLSERGVEIMLSTRVKNCALNVVKLENGQPPIPANTLIWTAGLTPDGILKTLPCKTEKGRIFVDETLAVPGYPGVWALGDCACCVDEATGKPFPPTAQHAIRQGKVAAQNIVASIRGAQPQPFRFRTLGQLAVIGKHTGVANIFGFQFSGFLAFALWRCVYLMKLPRLVKKLRVAVDWTLDIFFPKDLVQTVTLPAVQALVRKLEAASRDIEAAKTQDSAPGEGGRPPDGNANRTGTT